MFTVQPGGVYASSNNDNDNDNDNDNSNNDGGSDSGGQSNEDLVVISAVFLTKID